MAALEMRRSRSGGSDTDRPEQEMYAAWQEMWQPQRQRQQAGKGGGRVGESGLALLEQPWLQIAG